MMTLPKNNFEAASLVEYGRLVGGYVYCFYINWTLETLLDLGI